VQRWRLVVARGGPGPGSQRDEPAAWDSALTGSALPVAGLDLPAPRPRYAIAAPLPAGVPGEAELVDVWLTERLPRWRVREALEAGLPPGHRLVDLYDVSLGEPSLPGMVAASVYRVVVPDGGPSAGAIRSAATAMLAASTLPRQRPKGDATVAYDLRPFLDALVIEPFRSGEVLRMTLRHDPERGIGRPEEVLAELGERAGGPIPIAGVVRERIVLRDRVPEPAARPSPSVRGRR
jgi:radical SAM-linked protein